ncbi:protein O-glucosyltransferase 2-like [Ischnura elegans]|uniref:protein O-glucosyltransferase 2-like n=1 Tax=Ischnura elegans TaxID=197161 RepID=UPI001ED8BA39|nr:protein O-glucosyltransferase 2-like [Ischnura elegans]
MQCKLFVLFIFIFAVRDASFEDISDEIDPINTLVWGPGLKPSQIVMPARYFYIHGVNSKLQRLNKSPGNVFSVEITGDSEDKTCRAWVNILDRKDGSFIVRYKVFSSCDNFQIHIRYKGLKVAGSPYSAIGLVHADECDCPVRNFDSWYDRYGCGAEEMKHMYSSIISDLKPFKAVNFTDSRRRIRDKFNQPGSVSICNYVVKSNKVYRKCYGQYVGFKTFVDEILLSLSRKVKLPDIEFYVNLGDWPLIRKEKLDSKDAIIPMFSWCGSKDTHDIIMPTYDLTEATLECMGRVTLDMLSIQGNVELPWEERIEKGFWRGRDSRMERLNLVAMSRKRPDLLNASLTNFFFFRDQEEVYGPKEPHVSFFKFFDYKYQVTLDGTVAAYRLPYLLAGGSLVLKQDSDYYEHFYPHLKPGVHYLPVKSDLSDLITQIEWAKNHDLEAKRIGEAGRVFADKNLTPQSILCYHATLYKEWSKRLVSPVKVLKGRDQVTQKEQVSKLIKCDCSTKKSIESNRTSRPKDEVDSSRGRDEL